MRRTRKPVGQAGIALLVIGVLLYITAMVLSQSQPVTAMNIVFLGTMIYLPGSFMAVSHYNYVRGSGMYLTIMVSRVIFATALMVTLVSVMRAS